MEPWNLCLALVREVQNDCNCKMPNAKRFRRLSVAIEPTGFQPVVLQSA
jgi:hypothetical protein